MFVQPPDGLLQLLLLHLGQDVGELIAGLQEHAEDALVQLAEEVLRAFTKVQLEHGFPWNGGNIQEFCHQITG